MKNVLILGISGGIGSAIAEKFKAAGFEVIAPDENELDLSNRKAVDAYFMNHQIKELDALVHAAGINNPKPIEDLSFEDIDKTASINVLSLYQIIKLVLPALKKKKGAILGVSSLYGSFAREKRLAYVMSKHALNGLAKTLAIELAPHNVRVNTLSPGFADTPLTRKNNNEKTIKNLEAKIPLGRLASPDEIAKVAYFLCSSENTYLTGQDIVVDGGYSAGGFQN